MFKSRGSLKKCTSAKGHVFSIEKERKQLSMALAPVFMNSNKIKF